MKLKKAYLLIAAIAVLSIAGIIIYRNLEATSLAGTVGESLKQVSDRVILTVNGEPATEKFCTLWYLTIRLNPQNSGKSDLEVKKEALRKVIEDRALYSEAVKRGFLASEDEARKYAQEQRALLDSPQVVPESKEFFHEFLKSQGLSEEEYWEKMAPQAYRTVLSMNRLGESFKQSVNVPPPTSEEIEAIKAKHPEWGNISTEILAQQASQEKLNQLWEEFKAQIVKNAKVEILDPSLKEVFLEITS